MVSFAIFPKTCLHQQRAWISEYHRRLKHLMLKLVALPGKFKDLRLFGAHPFGKCLTEQFQSSCA